MDRRNADNLKNLFDRVHDEGAALLTSKQLLRWWGRQRMTPSIWADLNERWEENFDVPLLIGTTDTGFLLVWGEAKWLRPLTDWASGNGE
jgi:hypothetical protein